MIFFDDVGNESVHVYLLRRIDRLLQYMPFVNNYDVPIETRRLCQ